MHMYVCTYVSTCLHIAYKRTTEWCHIKTTGLMVRPICIGSSTGKSSISRNCRLRVHRPSMNRNCRLRVHRPSMNRSCRLRLHRPSRNRSCRLRGKSSTDHSIRLFGFHVHVRGGKKTSTIHIGGANTYVRTYLINVELYVHNIMYAYSHTYVHT